MLVYLVYFFAKSGERGIGGEGERGRGGNTPSRVRVRLTLAFYAQLAGRNTLIFFP